MIVNINEFINIIESIGDCTIKYDFRNINSKMPTIICQIFRLLKNLTEFYYLNFACLKNEHM